MHTVCMLFLSYPFLCLRSLTPYIVIQIGAWTGNQQATKICAIIGFVYCCCYTVFLCYYQINDMAVRFDRYPFYLVAFVHSPCTFVLNLLSKATGAKLKIIRQKYKWLRFLGYIDNMKLGTSFSASPNNVGKRLSPLVRGAFERYQSAEERQNLKSISAIEPGSIASLLRPSRADLDETGGLSPKLSKFSLDEHSDDEDSNLELSSLRKQSKRTLEAGALEAVLEDVVVEDDEDNEDKVEGTNSLGQDSGFAHQDEGKTSGGHKGNGLKIDAIMKPLSSSRRRRASSSTTIEGITLGMLLDSNLKRSDKAADSGKNMRDTRSLQLDSALAPQLEAVPRRSHSCW